MGKYLNIIFTFLFIVGLIIIYNNSDKKEEYLFIKLSCYYLLGSFNVNFNKLAIPLGFFMYLVFLHPKSNAKSKLYAALLGITFFIIGLSVPVINKYLYERPIEISSNYININTIDFQRDWQLIKDRLEVNDDARLEDFEIEYEVDGTIRKLKFELISNKEEGLVHYFIELLPDKQKYIIKPKKIEQWLQYDRLTTVGRFFHVLTLLNIEEVRPVGSYEWYVIKSSGELVSYAIKEYDKYIIISKDNVKKISNDELPIKGYYISSFGMEKESESSESTSYGNKGEKDYFFDVIKK